MTVDEIIEKVEAMDAERQVEVNYTDAPFNHPQGLLMGPERAFEGTTDDLKLLANHAKAYQSIATDAVELLTSVAEKIELGSARGGVQSIARHMNERLQAISRIKEGKKNEAT
jgi:hypothetical protein